MEVYILKNCSESDSFNFLDTIKNYFLKIDCFFRKLNLLWFILIMLLLTYLLPLLSVFILPIGESGPKFREDTMLVQLIILVVLAPLVETLIGQKWVILISRKLFKSNTAAIIISSIVFGFGHTYSCGYLIFACFIGIVLAYAYIVYEEKEYSPYWVVCSIHALRNLISWILANFVF